MTLPKHSPSKTPGTDLGGNNVHYAAPSKDRRGNCLSLPDEILGKVFDVVADDGQWNRNDVLSLSLTCKRLHGISEPALYRWVRLSTLFDPYDNEHPLNAKDSRPSYVRNLSVVADPRKGSGFIRQNRDMPQLIGRLVNLNTLQLKPWITRNNNDSSVWFHNFQHQLDRAAFAKLTQCFIDLQSPNRYCHLNITKLLQAPRLKLLSLVWVDLSPDHAKSIVKHSAPIEEIRLYHCKADDASMSAILEAPTALKKFDFAMTTSLHVKRHLEATQRAISIVADKQPGLQSFGVVFQYPSDHIDMSSGLTLDFTALKNVKEFSFRAPNTEPWTPIMQFDKLPSCERLEFTNNRLIEVDSLAQTLLSDGYRGMGIPKSLRRLDFFTPECHERPFNHDEQIQDDRLHQGIKLFMGPLNVPHLTYTQTQKHSRRILSAVRDPDSKANHYSIVDMTFLTGEAVLE